MIENKTPQMHSYHIFLFPFRWKNIFDSDKENKNADLKKKFDLNVFEQNLTKNSQWERENFKLDHPSKYNEYNYFYDFVREVLYDLGEDLKIPNNEINNTLIRHYSYTDSDINKGNTHFYHIKVKNGKHYALEIDSILLNIYGTGVGVLSFHLRNRDYPNSDDILKINQFGRRIYPPFFGLTDDDIYSGKTKNLCCFDEKDKEKLFDNFGAKMELADAIWIDTKKKYDKEKDKKDIKTYKFEEYLEKECNDKLKPTTFYHKGPFFLPLFIKKLFPENFFAEHWKDRKEKKVYIRPGLDDRMFVVTWYGNDKLANYLGEYHCQSYNYETDDWWYKYIFVDQKSPMVAHRKMKQKLINEHTYHRWAEYGTLFGMSRYSLVMLSSTLETLAQPFINATFTVRHLQTMYYKMAELSLLQRTSVIAFSDEVTHISDTVHNDNTDNDNLIRRIQNLYGMYILFVNKIYFREITAQEQGIEMYDILQRVMRVPNHVKDLDGELDELNRYAAMLEQKRENEEMKKHTILATIFLPAMLISGILGMNLFEGKEDIPGAIYSLQAHWFWWPVWIIFILILLWINQKNKKWKIWSWMIAFWGSFILILLDYYLTN